MKAETRLKDDIYIYIYTRLKEETQHVPISWPQRLYGPSASMAPTVDTVGCPISRPSPACFRAYDWTVGHLGPRSRP